MTAGTFLFYRQRHQYGFLPIGHFPGSVAATAVGDDALALTGGADAAMCFHVPAAGAGAAFFRVWNAFWIV